MNKLQAKMSAMDLDSTESGPDGGYADMDLDDQIHASSSVENRTRPNQQNSLLTSDKDSEKRSRDRILHQNYWKNFGDPFAHLVKDLPPISKGNSTKK